MFVYIYIYIYVYVCIYVYIYVCSSSVVMSLPTPARDRSVVSKSMRAREAIATWRNREGKGECLCI